MAQQNFDVSTESGKFLGAFLVTTVSETIAKICRRENKTNDDVAASIRDWQPLIESMNHWKGVHNFAQNFLDHLSDDLFVKGASRGAFLSDEDEILKAWKDKYIQGYEKKVAVYEANIKAFQEQAEKSQTMTPKAELPSDLTTATKNAVTALKVLAPRAYNKSDEFISHLKETASTVINREIKLTDAPAWTNGWIKEEFDGLAKQVLGYTDDILVNLIQVLDELYKRMVPTEDE